MTVSTRHGLRPWSAQILVTESLPIPTRAATMAAEWAFARHYPNCTSPKTVEPMHYEE
ncbi:hypothetical protein [Mycobacterium sp.]|uniref:hypothetical protein n=1 Tax=Mycobacterium sp. TaxID=1785 RepID=UPI003F9A428D